MQHEWPVELGRPQQTQDSALKQSWKVFPDMKPLGKCQLVHSEWSANRKDVNLARARSQGSTSGHRLWLNPEVWFHQAVLKPHAEWEPKWMAHNILVGKMLLHWISEPHHLLCLCFCVSSQTIYLHIAASCCIRSCSETQVQRKEKNNKKIKKTLQRYVWILLKLMRKLSTKTAEDMRFPWLWEQHHCFT